VKFSICIPQFNRIEYLIYSLDILKLHNHKNFEVVISDDCSTDDTEEVLSEYSKYIDYPITYYRFETNQGYDRNLRKTMELATGDYCFILGNDDALAHENVLRDLELFLINNNMPDLGFCNYCEFVDNEKVTKRAHYSKVIGTGADIGINKYSSFSFVAGLIFKKRTFDLFNTDRFDKSIYAQIALALHMICNNAILFSIQETWVRKDIVLASNGEVKKSNSYRDFINHNWFRIKAADGGLKSVINVIDTVLEDNQLMTQKRLDSVFKKLLFNTYPYWVIDYKSNGATASAFGLYIGLQPYKIRQFSKMSFVLKFKYVVCYQFVSILAFITPSKLFFIFKDDLYSWLKRK
jgi:glycosyltransferase involved in cell wall biosynthesis